MASCLEGVGHVVRRAEAGEEALKLAREDAPAFIVTELALPDLSGLALCRAVREDASLASTPVLMLTASGAEMNRVVAFEVGVDDFVSKPFNSRELALRVGAILRRVSRRGDAGRAEKIRWGRLLFDQAQHQVRVDGTLVALTAREFDILGRLMRSAGRVLSRGQILEDVWGARSGKTARVVDTHVKWIRRKLGPAGNYIETLRGVGYRFLDTLEPESPARPNGDAPASLTDEAEDPES